MAYNTVKIKKYLDIIEEYEAYEAVSPGMLVELRPGYSTIRKHATEGGNALTMIVLENELEGEGLEDAYAAGDMVQVWIPTRGDQGYVQLEDEQNIAIGDYLESNGAGYFQKAVDLQMSSTVNDTIYPLQIICQALEANDLSSLSAAGSSDTPTRQFIKVRFC